MPTPGFTAGDAKQENDPSGQNGRTLAMDTFPIWSELGSRSNGGAAIQWKNLFGRREAISYAVIIYSSLGREEEAFTGVINIFGAQLCWGLLGSCHPTLPCLILGSPIITISDGLSKKAHRLIGDITQVDSSQFISTPRRLKGVSINLFLHSC